MAPGSHTQNVQPTVASTSVGVANVAKNGRGMRTDPGWEYGVLIDEATRRVRCKFCQKEFTGGAHRLKLHLAGTSRDIRSCESVPDDVKKSMEDFMNGLRKKMLKKKCIDIEVDVVEEVAANSNEKRKSVGEIARNDMLERGLTTLTVEDSDSMASKTESESPTDTPPSPPKNVYKDPDDGRQRFLLELEFVQCLANPTYIHYLAQNRYFEDEAFIGYLKYLQYWQRPEYIKFIMYPHCLYFLELLQNANFRNAMAHPTNKELAHRQQFYFWKNYRNNRLKHILPKPLPEPTAALPASTQPQPPVPALPPPPPPPATNVAATTSSTQAPSPMPYGSGLAKNDTRNPTVDRRKRK